jgi:hypothetical protein
MSMRSTLLMILMILLLTPCHAALSEESPKPRLGNHVFIPVMAITEPFITTHVQTTVGVGSTVNSSLPVIDLSSDEVIGTVKANQLLAGIGFRFQYAAKNWLAVLLNLSTVGRLGTSTTSLVAEGITGAVGYNLGWQMRVHRTEKFILSGSVGLGNQNATFVNLIDWVDGIIDGTEVPLARARQSLRGSGGLHAGWGISGRFGLLGSLLMIYGESFEGSGANRWMADGRLALSYDMEYDIKIPLGLALSGGFYENEDLGGGQSGVWFWSARLGVQGRRDFSIGLDLTTSYFDSSLQGLNTQVSQISIDMRYYY